MVINLPNLITFLRILLIPVFILTYTSSIKWNFYIAAFLFMFAALTDFLDGFLARRLGEITKLGKLLDPVADKLLIVSALILLVDFDKVSMWLAIVIVGREFAVMGLRTIALSEGVLISVESLGKYKMVLQTVGIFLILLNMCCGWFDATLLGIIFLWGSALLGLVSGGQYFYQYWTEVMLKDQGKSSSEA